MLNWLLPSTGTRQLYRIVDAMLDTQILLSYAWRDINVIPRGTLPPHALVVALTPLLDDRAAGALLDLRGRGFDLVVIEVSPSSYLQEPKGELELLAVRLWRLRREALRDRFALRRHSGRRVGGRSISGGRPRGGERIPPVRQIGFRVGRALWPVLALAGVVVYAATKSERIPMLVLALGVAGLDPHGCGCSRTLVTVARLWVWSAWARPTRSSSASGPSRSTRGLPSLQLRSSPEPSLGSRLSNQAWLGKTQSRTSRRVIARRRRFPRHRNPGKRSAPGRRKEHTRGRARGRRHTRCGDAHGDRRRPCCAAGSRLMPGRRTVSKCECKNPRTGFPIAAGRVRDAPGHNGPESQGETERDHHAREAGGSGISFGDGPGRDRTCDLGIKSPLLYQLSYRPARPV